MRSQRARRTTASTVACALSLIGALTGGAGAAAATSAAALARHVASVPDSNYPIPAGALFVDATNGADTNAGTSGAPFATVAHAVAVAPAGSTIVLRAGTYRESVGILRKRLTFQAYPHEQVWLSGSVVVSSWTQDLADRPDGGAWVHTGWTTQFCQTCFDSRAIGPAYPNAGLPDQLFVNGRPLAQVTSLAAVVPGTFYVDYAQQALYVGSDPTAPGTVIEASTQAFAAQFNLVASGSKVLGIGSSSTRRIGPSRRRRRWSS